MTSSATSPSSPSSYVFSLPSSPMASPSLHHFSTPITLKPTDENFLIWKHQIFATLHGFDLLHFLDGTHVPSKFLPSEEHGQELISA